MKSTLSNATTHSKQSILKHDAVMPVILCFVIGAIWLVLPHPLLIVILCAVPIAIMMCLGNTFLMVLMFVIFSFFRIHEAIPVLFPLKIPLLLSLASLFSLAWHVAISQKIKIYWRSEFTIAALFFGLVVLGIVMASNKGIAIAYFKNVYWKIIIMMFAISYLTRTHKDFSRALVLAVVFGSVVGIVALMNKAQGIGLVEGTRVTIGRHLGSVLGDPNDLALVLMFPMAFAVGLALSRGLGRWYNLLGYISVPVLFFAVLATQSRGGLLGIVAVFGVFGYRRIKSKVLLAVVAGVFSIGLFIFAGISDRKSGGAAEDGIDASAQGRLYAWEAAAKMATHNPITGVGLDNFYVNYYFYSPHWDGLNHAVHSTWFGVLAETGIVGFCVFVWLIIALVRTSKRSLEIIERHTSWESPRQASVMSAASQALFAGMLGTIVSGTFLTQGFTWPIYILAGLIIALAKWTDTHCTSEK